MESVEHVETHETHETHPGAPANVEPAGAQVDVVDLDRIERDLADVEIALSRLEAGTYWTCEATGQSLRDELLESNPTARRIATS